MNSLSRSYVLKGCVDQFAGGYMREMLSSIRIRSCHAAYTK